MPEVEAKDAPGQVGVTSTQLTTLMENALSNALNQRLGPASGSPSAISGGDPNTAGMAQEPDNDVLKAIHKWTLNPQAIAPTEGQLIVMNQDHSIEVLDNNEYEHRSAQMGMMPALAGTVNTLDNLGGLDIPWGSVLLGALPGAMASEIIDGLMPAHSADGSINFMNLLVKGGIAWAGVQFGDRLVGRRASQFFAGGLILFVAADLLPVDQWVATLLSWFNRSAPSGLASHEQGLARHEQASPASTFNPSAGDDALDALRGHRIRRAA